MKRFLSILSLLLFWVVGMSAQGEVADKAIYLNPGIWDVENATERYAVYMFDNENGEAWADFLAVEGEGVFKAVVDSKYTNIVLCRMNGETTENNWDNVWNQTEDITGDNFFDKALYTITGWGESKSTYEVTTYGEEPQTTTYTVSFKNTVGWEEVYAYAWYKAPEGEEGFAIILGEWPGTKMTKGEDDVWTISFTSGVEPNFIIFNNGKEGNELAQTDDLAFENGKTYTIEEEPQGETYTASFKNTAGWEDVYAYAWYEAPEGESGFAIILGAWPGTKMTAPEGEDNVWTISFTSGVEPNFIIFNNGKEGEEKAQTDNLAFENGKTYTIEEEPQGETYTASFKNTIGWEKVYAYAWYAAPEGETGFAIISDEWPGTAMTPGDDDVWTVSFTSTLAPTGIVFSDGTDANKSEDFAFENGKTYEIAKTTYTVQYVNTTGWADVKAYAWAPGEGDNVELFLGDWPGTSMIAVNEEYTAADGKKYPIYEISFEAYDAPKMIIFNNGKEGEELEQTADLTFENNKQYVGELTLTWTASFKNTVGWDAVYAYAWYEATEGEIGTAQLTGDYPGVPMVKNDEGVWTVSFESELTPSYILFNNGLTGVGNQTDNLPFEQGKEYDFDKTTFTVQFANTAAWEAVNAYAWTGEGESAVEFLGEWPGTAMGLVDTEYEAADGQKYPVYEYQFKSFVAPEKIIFNNGVDQQTADLDFEDGKLYIGEIHYNFTVSYKDSKNWASDSSLVTILVLR